MHPAIRVSNLTKYFRLGGRARGGPNLTERIASLFRSAPKTAATDFWALKGVSFEVASGEVIGIVGRNGAGKSTLLKVLSRIIEPTAGRAELRGRVGSLLEVGTGFHQELTGRENIYLNGSVLGMSRREIARRFDAIVAFAGVEPFLDTPVKRYSSGMYVRLAFAVAAHLEPEILIIDEVLAVGDAEFQNKCLGKMREVSASGRTVLFVSHNMTAVQNLCSRCVWLRDGAVAADGPARGVVEAYNREALGGTGAAVDLAAHRGRTGGSIPAMKRVLVADDADGRSAAVPMRGTARIEVEFAVNQPLDDATLGVVVKDSYNAPIFGINNKVTPGPAQAHPLRAGKVVCRLPDLPLMPGVYPLDLYFGNRIQDFDVIYNAAELTVVPADVFGTGKLPPSSAGPICWPATWEIVPSE